MKRTLLFCLSLFVLLGACGPIQEDIDSGINNENNENNGNNENNENKDDGTNGDDTSANNVIYYTSINSSIVEPNTEQWDVNIVSNVYENGIGVITFDKDLESIGATAFSMSENLQSIELPNNVISIENMAFASCLQLSEVKLGNKLKTIGEDAFLSCWLLKQIDLPSSLETIGSAAFMLSGLESITIPYGVTEICNGAFGTLLIEKVTIPGSVKKIGRGAFRKCELISVKIDAGVEIIEPYAFEECTKLKDVTLGQGLKSIGEYAFSTTSIENVTIPESVESIGACAFTHYGWGTAQSLDIFCKPTTPPTAILESDGSWNGFYNRYDTDMHIYVPMSSVDAYKSAEGWKQYESYIIGYEF